jgi:hypothetical protein
MAGYKYILIYIMIVGVGLAAQWLGVRRDCPTVSGLLGRFDPVYGCVGPRASPGWRASSAGRGE